MGLTTCEGGLPLCCAAAPLAPTLSKACPSATDNKAQQENAEAEGKRRGLLIEEFIIHGKWNYGRVAIGGDEQSEIKSSSLFRLHPTKQFPSSFYYYYFSFYILNNEYSGGFI